MIGTWAGRADCASWPGFTDAKERQMIRNIIFDWSGTLNDEIETSYAANSAVFKKFGLVMMPFDQYKEEFELPYMNWYRRFLPGIGKDEVHSAYVEALKHIPKPRCFPWANGLLEDLKASGKILAILSALEQDTLRELIDEHGMNGFFTEIMGSVHDKRVAVHELLKKCRFGKDDTVFIGDMVHDIEAGKAAGIRTIAVTWGYDSKAKLRKADPDHFVDSIEELRKELLSQADV